LLQTSAVAVAGEATHGVDLAGPGSQSLAEGD
jgi:hypothetical protein